MYRYPVWMEARFDIESDQWSDPLTVGNGHIDHQHRQIIRLVKALEESGRGPASGNASSFLLSNLMLSMIRHFRDEEAMLKNNGCPWVEEHVASHVYFIEKLSGMLLMEADEVLDQAAPFIRQWLEAHWAEEEMTHRSYLSAFSETPHRPVNVCRRVRAETEIRRRA